MSGAPVILSRVDEIELNECPYRLWINPLPWLARDEEVHD
jgi:hypothetical protein